MSERIWHKGECILHVGRPGVDGYGKRKIKGKTLRAHRVAYCEANSIDINEIAGLVVMHLCDTPMCVNPDHLCLGTNRQNIDDMLSKGRQLSGEKSPHAKLTLDQVNSIRGEYVKYSRNNCARVLSEKYVVSRRAIAAIVSGKVWK